MKLIRTLIAILALSIITSLAHAADQPMLKQHGKLSKKQQAVLTELQRELSVDQAGVVPAVEYGKAPLFALNMRKDPDGQGTLVAMNAYLNTATTYKVWLWDVKTGAWSDGGTLPAGLSYVGMGYATAVGPIPQLRPVLP